MNWAAHVLNCEPHLDRNTAGLVAIIARFFTSSALGRCSFYDSQSAALLDVDSTQVRHARHLLQRKPFLVELHSPNNGKPQYRLRFRTSANDGDAAA
jgi:hypothetical protein